jgi:FtsH-binding integral membrane protein
MRGRCSWRRSASRATPTVVDQRTQPGWRQVALVAAGVVAVVIGAAVLTSFLPTAVQQAIFHGPVLIGVLIVGTAWVLWRIAHGRPIDGQQ